MSVLFPLLCGVCACVCGVYVFVKFPQLHGQFLWPAFLEQLKRQLPSILNVLLRIFVSQVTSYRDEFTECK